MNSKQYDDVSETLVKMRNNMSRLTELWDNADEDLDEALTEGYPFDKSFDELHSEVTDWVYEVIERIERLKAVKRCEEPVVTGQSTTIVGASVEDMIVNIFVTAEFVELRKNGEYLRGEDIQTSDTRKSMHAKLRQLGMSSHLASHVINVINGHLAAYDKTFRLV